MNIVFNQEEHSYTVNNEIASISVTQLLRKHGLAPNYSAVNPEVLKQASERGTNIHRDLECLISVEDYEPFTREGEAFSKYLKEFVDCACAEQLLAYRYKSMWICGTADVIGYFKKKDKGCFVADHKTTANINKEYVSWQVSILDYMLRKLGNEPINDKSFKEWKGADEFMCFHYSKDGDLNVIKLDKVPDEEIERLFECEYNGEIYKRRELVLDDEIEGNMITITRSIDQMEKTLKALKAQQDKIKNYILEKMQEQGIKSVKNDFFSLTYVAPQEKVVVDSKKLKDNYPEVYKECLKLSQVKPQVRIKIMGDDEDEE